MIYINTIINDMKLMNWIMFVTSKRNGELEILS